MQASDRRPRLVFGPGMIGALAIVIALVVTGHLPGEPKQAKLPVHSALPAAPEPIAPEPTWLRKHVQELGMTAAQTARMDEIILDWEQHTATNRTAVELESRRLAKQLDGADGQRPERVIQEDGPAYHELSSRLAEARQAAWQAELDMLTDSQREKVRDLRAAAPLEMR